MIRPDTLYFGTSQGNFNLNIFQDFVSAYFKQERQCLCNYRLLKLFQRVNTAENHHLNVSVKLFNQHVIAIFLKRVKSNHGCTASATLALQLASPSIPLIIIYGKTKLFATDWWTLITTKLFIRKYS